MTKVNAALAVALAAVLAGAFQLWSLTPEVVGNSVIAEKAVAGTAGNQVATLLPANLTAKQGALLNKAYEIAKADGHRDPAVVQSILLQETMAGGMSSYKVANPGPEAYFGPMQIKLAAAKDVLQRWPSLFSKYAFHTKTDDEIKANLILNETFNIEVGSKYLLMLKQQYGFSGRQLVNAYNRGPGGVHGVDDNFHYAIGAERKLAALKRKR